MAYAEKHPRSSPVKRSITETAPKASLIMLLSGLFLLIIVTAASTNSPSPTEIASFIAPASLFLGIAVGGVFCGVRLQGGDGYACAAISAAILVSILLAVKLLIPAPDERLSLGVGIAIHLLSILTAVIGALIAGRLQKRRRGKKSKHRR